MSQTMRPSTRLLRRSAARAIPAALAVALLALGACGGSPKAPPPRESLPATVTAPVRTFGPPGVIPEYNIPGNCAAMADAVGTPAMQKGCVHDETEAKAAAKTSKAPEEVLGPCRAESDDQGSYVLLWGCIRKAMGAAADGKTSAAP
jgi:hypothetical protein